MNKEMMQICTDFLPACDGAATATVLCQKRWRTEKFHESLKTSTTLETSSTRCVRVQSNHMFMSTGAVFKLECLGAKYHNNHFALGNRLCVSESTHAFDLLRAGASEQHQ